LASEKILLYYKYQILAGLARKTDLEIGWAGLTEREAEVQGLKVKVGRFPFRALRRARTLGREVDCRF
jgi:pyruvate/2-oxoglutarate dehydrogenase complex dihydrolipoamide dehydrogenase (E3) component